MTEADRLGARIEASGRTLRRAIAEGTIRAIRRGPRQVQIPTGEQDYIVRHWPLISRLRLALRTEPAVEAAILVGSQARGDDRPGSDLDLLVRFRGEWTLDNLYGLEERLSARLGRQVDVIVFDEGSTPAVFLREVLREGRPVVDRGEFWESLRKRSGMIEREAKRYEREREMVLGL
ncbi:MAG TPA: nucleotidyltransferase domain-containing protein [Candidatus Dormibacteraeota bacterium]|nr:nucleotidyltransferase domain-containing protein [Candidatus Dormibacteraeota bacterium]